MSSLARNDSPENVSKSPLASRLSRDNKSGGLEHKHTKHGGEGKQPVTQVDEVRAKLAHCHSVVAIESMSQSKLSTLYRDWVTQPGASMSSNS